MLVRANQRDGTDDKGQVAAAPWTSNSRLADITPWRSVLVAVISAPFMQLSAFAVFVSESTPLRCCDVAAHCYGPPNGKMRAAKFTCTTRRNSPLQRDGMAPPAQTSSPISRCSEERLSCCNESKGKARGPSAYVSQGSWSDVVQSSNLHPHHISSQCCRKHYHA